MPQTAPQSTPFQDSSFELSKLPDYDDDMVNEDDFVDFAKALAGTDSAPTPDDTNLRPQRSNSEFITALNDWRPVYQKARKQQRKKKRRPPRRGKDETREGFVYTLLKWPLFVIVMGWIIVLGAGYMLTRLYIFSYEHYVTLRGRRNRLRTKMREATTYDEWIAAAKDMDRYLGNEAWKQEDAYAYYNDATTTNVRDQMRRLRLELEDDTQRSKGSRPRKQIAEDLRTVIEGSVKDNFSGTDNPHLYSETYYGTKALVQDFIDETAASLRALSQTPHLTPQEKLRVFQHLHTNYGKSALCLSGGATFAYYHFGLARALLEANALPKIITGTSGGALVAALLATRTDSELKACLVPALAHRIRACSDPITTWLPRWYRTGARFDSVDWAKRCAWFCRGSLTFREAYERTGRILNVTCIPSEPSSPTLLANYLTAPDCVIWSAVLASAAVPGILNPVVLMRKTRSGRLSPYSFGNKWKDGSLRTDIPLRALNTHFNVNFSIVSQVNPHINLFFFSSRGAVGRPVTHRRGRGWRGGFLGSATEQYLKLDLTKWLKVLRHLELLPRYLGQDWSEVWLQRFSGTITIWPRVSVPSDFVNILSDPSPERLARMLRVGMQSAWPKLKFIRNRGAVERGIEGGWEAASRAVNGVGGDGLGNGMLKPTLSVVMDDHRVGEETDGAGDAGFGLGSGFRRTESPSLSKRLSGWLSGSPTAARDEDAGLRRPSRQDSRRSSVFTEINRQSQVFFDDSEEDMRASASEEEEHEHEHEPEQGLHASDREWDGVEYAPRAG